MLGGSRRSLARSSHAQSEVARLGFVPIGTGHLHGGCEKVCDATGLGRTGDMDCSQAAIAIRAAQAAVAVSL
jgi:hypothetical protein